MFGRYTYLLWLALFMGVPLLLLLWWRRLLWAQRRALGWVVLGSLVGGWAWDLLAVRYGLWHYNPAHIAGLWLVGLPLEEWLWIVGATLLFGGVTVVLAEWLGVDDGPGTINAKQE
ncbi:MAG: lycopene cyclase domain-containing protein [Caldilineaceae bacterium]